MWKKVLIANRGEIACRVLRTLKRLDVRSVAVYSDADRTARHVLDADEAVYIGPSPAAQSYLDAGAILRAAIDTGAEAIHPGYGFLSENPEFAEAVEKAGLCFVGPTSEQMRRFGLKHEARAIAEALGVPMLPGTSLIADAARAVSLAEGVGYPLMIKSTAGGGGIGMQLCRDRDELVAKFESVCGLARKNFANGGVFLERFVTRARHIEVQIFGDGRGEVLALGERDCSAQRRNQKVVEETPAPRLEPEVRRAMHEAAIALGRAVSYRSAGTVEFVYDDATGQFYFLEVNTRLQVEHGVTELVYGIDLVEWMLRVAAGADIPRAPSGPRGHAVEVRIYAEDPARDFRPSAGRLTEVEFPSDVRVDAWIERGTEVSGFYDPMLAKLMCWGVDREQAVARLSRALASTKLAGIETNLEYLRRVVDGEVCKRGVMTTAHLASIEFASSTIEVVRPGTLSTVQDFPGRLGYWDVGIPPSGPMDDLAFRLANRAVGNLAGTAGLEFTMTGPTLRFGAEMIIALGGADFQARLDGVTVPRYTPIVVRAGQLLEIGSCVGPGCRAYLAIRHGIDTPSYLGSRATFTLGGFGGHAGRALGSGDVLHVCKGGNVADEPMPIELALQPELVESWTIAVIYGPHGAPDFFQASDIEELFATNWEVHFNSARTGVRLIGPKPRWARKDGGEAGLHPSNLHDNGYAIGTIDFTGDMPILLGPDGPSLGGFVCPATVVAAERWKLGQLKPGAKVRFLPIDLESAGLLECRLTEAIEQRKPEAKREVAEVTGLRRKPPTNAVVRELPEDGARPRVVYRPSGDKYLLVEYGPMVLDLKLRFRVHLLMQRLFDERHEAIVEVTPGIRSLLIHYDSRRLTLDALLDRLESFEAELPPLDQVTVPTRVVRLPLSWDDPATRLAIEKYMQGVRKNAPWTPSNIEFIRRINGLASEDEVKRIVFDASYLVLGLGDVYLGAPVATPLDPRHRLVTTKYNPARTWTPENAVGIGGAYLCVYGMEGPGGYQFVGRTLQMFNRHKQTKYFDAERPWLLRFFDQIRFYPVSAEDLLEMREAFPHGRVELDIEEEQFVLADYLSSLERNRPSIEEWKAKQQAAFEAERHRWVDDEALLGSDGARPPELSRNELSDGHEPVESHVQGSVWKVNVKPGDQVHVGDALVVLESMKMELSVEAPIRGTVERIAAAPGQSVDKGQVLVVLRRDERQAVGAP